MKKVIMFVVCAVAFSGCFEAKYVECKQPQQIDGKTFCKK